jgi:hypothetical protein
MDFAQGVLQQLNGSGQVKRPPPFAGRGFGKEADARPSQRRWGPHLPEYHASPPHSPRAAVLTVADDESDDETAGGSGLADQRGPNWERNRARKERSKINKKKRSYRPITSSLPLPN